MGNIGYICLNGVCRRQPHQCNGQYKKCPEGFVCVNEHCFPPCTSNDDCPHTRKCDFGICDRIKCLKNSGCPVGWKCINKNCKPPGNCNQKKICPEGLVCEDESCTFVPETVCKSTIQCNIGYICLNGVCRRQPHQCNGQYKKCPEGFVCVNEHCFPPCTSNDDCPHTRKCDFGICDRIKCLKNSGCPVGWKCINKNCKPPGNC